MTRITLMSAVAALAFTPAALAQYEDPDNAYMNESPTRQDRVQRSEDFYDDDGVDTSGTMGPRLTNDDWVEEDFSDDPEPQGDWQRDTRTTGTEGIRADIEVEDDPMVRTAAMEMDRMSRLEQLFHAIDMDGNGMVSRAEWGQWQSDSGRAYRFDAFNTDNDSALSWDEYMAAADEMYASVG